MQSELHSFEHQLRQADVSERESMVDMMEQQLVKPKLRSSSQQLDSQTSSRNTAARTESDSSISVPLKLFDTDSKPSDELS